MVQFSNLMLLRASPLYWREIYAPVYAQRMREFLLHLLNPEMPGFAALRVPLEYSWRYGKEAASLVEEVYNEAWLKDNELLQKSHKAVIEEVYQKFEHRKLEVFLNGQRLWACAEAIPWVAGNLAHAPGVIGEFYFGLSIEWLLLDYELFLVPHLRASNFVPSDPHIAPPTPYGYRPPSPMSHEDAAKYLKHLKRAESIFQKIRRAFSLDEHVARIKDWRVESAAFYYAEPTQMPAEPDGFLTLPPYRSALEHLGRVFLGTEDLNSSDVEGALLEGNLLTLRREIFAPLQGESERALVQRFYLILPWWSGDQSREEVERETASLTIKRSLVEFTFDRRAERIHTDLAIPTVLVDLWNQAIDEATHLTSELDNLIAYEAIGSPVKQKVFNLVNYLRVMLARLEAKVVRVTGDIVAIRQRWKRYVETMSLYPLFTSRPIPGIRPLQDIPSNSVSYRYSEEFTDRATARAELLRKSYEAVEGAIQDLTEQEQREEQKREERFREEQREQEEQRQRMLNYVLAILAAITAFPIIIGQMGWAELKEVIIGWPGFFRSLGFVLESLHPYLVLVAAISAGFTIAFLLTILILTFFSSRGTRKPRVRKEVAESAGVEEWRNIGSKITQVWRLVDHYDTLVGKRVEEKSKQGEDSVIASMRAVDELDQIVCNNLLEVWEWLTSQPVKDLKEEVDHLQLRVWQFIIRTELLCNRPTPFPFPVALCLLRYKGPDLAASNVVSDYEFRKVLEDNLLIGGVRIIDKLAREKKGLPAEKFVEEIKQLVEEIRKQLVEEIRGQPVE